MSEFSKWDRLFIDVAKRVAELSTCYKYKVGCVIVKDNRIVSIGYNGTPSGWEHCIDNPDALHSVYEIHAEQNAIAFAAKEGISTRGAVLYCTHLPCFSCAKIIVASGISKVIYSEDYTDRIIGDESVDFMFKSGVEVLKFRED